MPAIYGTRRLVATGAVALVAFGLTTGSALADGPLGVPVVTMEWFASSDGIDPIVYNMETESTTINDMGGGTYEFLGNVQQSGTPLGTDPVSGGPLPSWTLDWNITANADPFVTADLAVTNFTGAYQDFFALVTVNISPIVGATMMNGNVSATVTDFGFDGAEITNSGALPIYDALIDGSSARTLWDSISIANPNPNENASSDTNFGSPAGELGPEALNSISVWLNISVDPFSTANVVGFFEVTPVPAPGGFGLLAGLALFGRRRRR